MEAQTNNDGNVALLLICCIFLASVSHDFRSNQKLSAQKLRGVSQFHIVNSAILAYFSCCGCPNELRMRLFGGRPLKRRCRIPMFLPQQCSPRRPDNPTARIAPILTQLGLRRTRICIDAEFLRTAWIQVKFVRLRRRIGTRVSHSHLAIWRRRGGLS